MVVRFRSPRRSPLLVNVSALAAGEYGQWKMKWVTEQLAGDKSPAKFAEEVQVCRSACSLIALWQRFGVY